MFRTLAITGAAAVVLAACNLPKLVPPAHAQGFKPNCYADLSSGFAINEIETTSDDVTVPVSASGAFVEIGGGCDVQAGRFVFGPWGSFSLSDTDAKLTADGETLKLSIDNTFAAGLRAGFLIQDTTIVFGKVGYATSEADGIGSRLDGIRVGGGLEAQLIGNLWFRFGGDHTFYDTETENGVKARTSATEVKAGAVIKF